MNTAAINEIKRIVDNKLASNGPEARIIREEELIRLQELALEALTKISLLEADLANRPVQSYNPYHPFPAGWSTTSTSYSPSTWTSISKYYNIS